MREDGREYYAVSTEFDLRKAGRHPFVSEHVLPKLPKRRVTEDDGPDVRAASLAWKPRAVIAEEIRHFAGGDPEFWADYASYDWVALCQLYGTMMDLPETWPRFCRDVQQLRKLLGVSRFTVNPRGGEHDALNDAWECKARHDMLAQRLRASIIYP